MIPLLAAFAVFLAWAAIGLTVLQTARLDTSALRVALTAPALGSVAMVLPIFLLSYAGVAVSDTALPIAVALLVASAVVLARGRPPVPPSAGLVLVVCFAALFLSGWPLLTFGFDWIANANDDMANYVLSATELLHRGLLAPLDVEGLTHDRDFASFSQVLHSSGSRPGADLELAAVAHLLGRPPYEAFMPVILAFNLCTICATAALAMQASRRGVTAAVAAVLIAVSPLATFAVVQQLLPQVWGLGLAAALFAFLMRPQVHDRRGPAVGEVAAIGLLASGLVLVYVELAPTVVLAYLLYVAVLAVRRELELRTVAWFWPLAVLIVAVLLNGYLLREIDYVRIQAHAGLGRTAESLFGYALVPSALPGVLGMSTLPPGPGTDHLSVRILIAIVALAAIAVMSLIAAVRGDAPAVALVALGVLGAVLAVRESDFGLLKLYMFVQPFVAATIAVWVTRWRLWAGIALALPVALLAGNQIATQHDYVDRSRNPIDLRNASSRDLLPAFRRQFDGARVPVVSVTENPTLAKLQAAAADQRPLYLVTRDLFTTIGAPFLKSDLHGAIVRFRRDDGWRARSFDLVSKSAPQTNPFSENVHASALVSSGNCLLALPSGSQQVVNRRTLPEGAPNLVFRPCGQARDLLAYTTSRLGQAFYLARQQSAVSFYQLEPDYFHAGRSLAGFGRYVLFRVLRPSPGARLELELTNTVLQDGSNRLPPAAAVGATRQNLPLVGRGSARVFSPPLRPQTIDGQPYLLLDMQTPGRILSPKRPALQGLYGSSVPVDIRHLTTYVRNISLVSASEYANLRAPRSLQSFTTDFRNQDLEYSGIYEDGWLSENAYAMLSSGRSRTLLVRADVLPRKGQHLDVFVDGRRVASRDVSSGLLDLRLRVPRSKARRRVELRWSGTVRLQPPNPRPVTALLKYVGFV